MNQTRSLLIVAWLTVAALLWMAWDKEHVAPAAAQSATAASSPIQANAPSSSVPAVPTALPATAPTAAASPAAVGSTPLLSVTTDVLHVTLDGGALHSADVLRYPQTDDPGSPSIRLFADDPAHFFEAQSGWVSTTGAAPTHEAGFVPEGSQRDFTLSG